MVLEAIQELLVHLGKAILADLVVLVVAMLTVEAEAELEQQEETEHQPMADLEEMD
jgi:hypothetical protein